MRRAAAVLLALGLLVVAPRPGAAKPDAAKVSTVQLEKGMRVQAAALADVNGDGARDLLVASSTRGEDFDRALSVHFRREGEVCFETKPDVRRELPAAIVAFATGDLEPDPGEEVLLFTATGAYTWRTAGGADARLRKIVTGEFLWQLPHPREVFHFGAAVRDLDGDGLDDVVLPEPGGYRIALQRRDEKGSSFDAVSRPTLPDPAAETGSDERVKARARFREIKISLAIGDAGEPSALTVTEGVPNPVFLDFDGDGRTDLLAQQGDHLFVWLQRPDGGFDAGPGIRETFPIEVDRGRRLDVSYGAYAADLDRDRRADCVVIAGDRKSEEARVQVLVYVQGRGKGAAAKTPDARLFGPRGIPQQVLLVSGFAGSPELSDIDGDGAPDLVMGSIRVDALDVLRAASSGKVDAELFVWRNHGGSFDRKPSFAHTMGIPSDEVNQAGRRITARFIGDATGDGISDLLVRDRPNRLRVFPLRREGRGLAVAEEPLSDTRIYDRADLLVFPGDPPEILVLERRQVLHVRFR